MFGVINVAAGAPTDPGSLGFAATSPHVGEGAGTATLTVQRTGGDDGAVSVQYTTANGTATSPGDYTPASGTLNWPDNDDDPRTFTVAIQNDTADENAETILLTLTGATGGAAIGSGSATLTIDDNDDAVPNPGKLQFSGSSFSGKEGTSAAIGVSRDEGTAGPVSVQWAVTGGTATAGSDFTAPGGSVSFGNGEGGTKSFPVPLALDELIEGDETVTFGLSGPSGGATLGTPVASTLVLRDANLAPGDVTPEEEACDQARLFGWLRQFRFAAPGTTKKSGLALSLTPGGDPFGVAFTGNGPGSGEGHLAFAVNAEETPLKRDPTKPQLQVVSLARSEAASDVLAKASPDRLSVSINPGTAPNPPAAALITIDNTQPAGLIFAAKPAKPLANLLRVCQQKTTALDAHVLRVLTKVLRPSASSPKAVLAIYRGEGSDRYRIDAYTAGATGQAAPGRLALELEVEFTNQDELLRGTLRILPRCVGSVTVGCTTSGPLGVDVLKAVRGGLLAPAPIARVFTLGTDGSGQPLAVFDWRDVLVGTTWLKPL